MARISISDSRRHFVRDGRPWFYLADTVWSAFTHPTPEEWDQYLEVRHRQGFNALQINVLPQWDASSGAVAPAPFALDADGRWDYAMRNDAYFSRAANLLERATARGFVPALVLLWRDFVPGAAHKTDAGAMSAGAAKAYVEHAIRTFTRFEPVYLVSGDTGFNADSAAEYFRMAIESVKRLDPDGLVTLHLKTQQKLPETFERDPNLDFYMYQSGHRAALQDLPYELAKYYHGRDVVRPVVNGEPCYEAHGKVPGFERFAAADVRKATWQSLLSGASAGVAYGAHGIWNWHRRSATFSQEFQSRTPLPWSDALDLPGAWDVGFARWLFEKYALWALEPMEAATGNLSPDIRIARTPDQRTTAAFAPFPTCIELPGVHASEDVVGFDLSRRAVFRPSLVPHSIGITVFPPPINGDFLILATSPR